MSGSNGIIKTPVYEWSNKKNGVACSGTTCFNIYYSDGCPIQHVQLDRDIIRNGTTPKPGYIPYTYPHPLRNEEPQCPQVTANFELKVT